MKPPLTGDGRVHNERVRREIAEVQIASAFFSLISQSLRITI
jgi:hypothetical protein